MSKAQDTLNNNREHPISNNYYSKTIADGRYLGKTSKAADSNKLDNLDSTAFSLSGHNHSGTYLPINGKAADSNKLDNLDSTAFSLSGHDHGNSYLPSGGSWVQKWSGTSSEVTNSWGNGMYLVNTASYGYALIVVSGSVGNYGPFLMLSTNSTYGLMKAYQIQFLAGKFLGKEHGTNGSNDPIAIIKTIAKWE